MLLTPVYPLLKRSHLFRSYAVAGSLARLLSRSAPEANLDHCEWRKPLCLVSLDLESHFGSVSLGWLYYIAPKIIKTLKPYHDDDVGTQSAGSASGVRVRGGSSSGRRRGVRVRAEVDLVVVPRGGTRARTRSGRGVPKRTGRGTDRPEPVTVEE